MPYRRKRYVRKRKVQYRAHNAYRMVQTSGSRYRPSARRIYHPAPDASLRILKTPSASDRLMVKLKYIANINFTSATSDYHNFAGNNPYDPDTTGVGHQVLGWDEWSAIYSRYRCYGSVIKVTAVNHGTAEPMLLVMAPVRSTTGILPYALGEQAYAQKAVLTAKGNSARIIKRYLSTKKFLGLKRLEDDQGISAAVDSSPTRLWYWQISGSPVDTSGTNTMTLLVEITYYIEFYTRFVLGQS